MLLTTSRVFYCPTVQYFPKILAGRAPPAPPRVELAIFFLAILHLLDLVVVVIDYVLIWYILTAVVA